MIIDHIGIVVKSLREGIQHWETCYGYRQNSAIITNTRQQVRVAFLAKADSLTIKLVEPCSASSSVFAFAQRGGGLHHLCFRCEDLKTQIAFLQEQGVRLMVAPQPGEAFGNREIAFLLGRGNLNFELIDTDQKVGWNS